MPPLWVPSCGSQTCSLSYKIVLLCQEIEVETLHWGASIFCKPLHRHIWNWLNNNGLKCLHQLSVSSTQSEVALSSTAQFCHCTLLCNGQHSCFWSLSMPIVNYYPQVVPTPAAICPLLPPLLVGHCVVFHHCCLLLSLHANVQSSMLS